MGPKIKRFVIEGAVRDTQHLERKQFFEEERLEKRMYREGYVPVLDITPLVNVERIPGKETFRYDITIYGVKVVEPKEYEGWLNGQLIKASNRSKLKRLYSPSDLM